MGTRPAPRWMRALEPWAMMRAPVAVAMRPASVRPRSRTARPVSMSMAGSPARSALAHRSIASVPTGAGAATGGTGATPSASFHAVSAGRMSVATWPGAVRAADVDDARAGLARVVKVGEPVAEPGTQVQQGGGRPVGHAPVAVGGAGHHALEEAEHTADAVHLVQRGHEVHLGRARIREADLDSARHQRSRQTLRTVHRDLLWVVV